MVFDEVKYEGTSSSGWGNLSGEDMVHRFWEGRCRHLRRPRRDLLGPRGRIWWSKGGRLVGTSPARIAFLEQVVATSPTGVLEPLPSDFDLPWAGVQDEYLVSYHGRGRPRERHVLLPPGQWRVDLLDTWRCARSTGCPECTRRSCWCRCPPSPTKPYGSWRSDAYLDHARPGLARHQGRADPRPRRLRHHRGRHVLLVRREQGALDAGQRHLALGRALLLVDRPLQLGRTAD